ncbi:hypothetical protein SASPL_118484 [Salvia splendens]|uniref:Phytosulfokine n=1 Tax=Salvia splendens TaxID=180675 RepID=A0A8X8XZH0_SALSN|nr:hypothetical protein SASPL_118484 [Salvia splendens]
MGKTTTTTICIITTFLLLLLLLSSHITARPGPTFHDVTPIENHHAFIINNDPFVFFQEQEGQKVADRDNCVGLKDDECMMRRTIEAQLDYIYTQKKKQP